MPGRAQTRRLTAWLPRSSVRRQGYAQPEHGRAPGWLPLPGGVLSGTWAVAAVPGCCPCLSCRHATSRRFKPSPCCLRRPDIIISTPRRLPSAAAPGRRRTRAPRSSALASARSQPTHRPLWQTPVPWTCYRVVTISRSSTLPYLASLSSWPAGDTTEPIPQVIADAMAKVRLCACTAVMQFNQCME